MSSTDFTLPKLRTVPTSKTTGVVELRYAPRDAMNESKPSEHIMNEAMPPFPMKRATLAYGKIPGEYGYPEMKVSVFDNIKPGDKVQVWLPVEGVDGDSIHLVGGITTGRESIVGHKPKERTPDEIWAGLADMEKNMIMIRERLSR